MVPITELTATEHPPHLCVSPPLHPSAIVQEAVTNILLVFIISYTYAHLLHNFSIYLGLCTEEMYRMHSPVAWVVLFCLVSVNVTSFTVQMVVMSPFSLLCST